MARPTDVIVTGFVKSGTLLKRSLAPLGRLQDEGIIRHIHCVTWDDAEFDPWVAPVKTIPGVKLTRVPQPKAEGTAFQRGVIYQVENLAAGLKLLPDDGALVLKWRPDFIASHSFLRKKLLEFDQVCQPPANVCLGVAMPPRAFDAKLWIPWADSNSPFFYEDAVFLGLRRDVEKMVTPLVPADLEIMGDPYCGSYTHAVRFGKPFLTRYPLFENHFRFYRLFPHDMEYRRRLVPYLVDSGFYWHVLIAHAWILHSHFHVDIGAPGDLAFYANAVNRDADWSRFETLTVTSPYNDVTGWRKGTEPGKALTSVGRAFGRIMDDRWQNAIFTQALEDLPRDTLVPMMENVARCRDGRLNELEAEFYREVESICQRYHPTKRALEASEVCGTGRPEGQGVAPYPSAVAAI